jgi:hypothetical protein
MKDKETAVDNVGSTHQRSPNYPAISLPESIKDARRVFAAEKRTVLSQESAAHALGYKSLSGPSRTKIAALRRYGLVSDVGDGLQISQLAMRILHQPDSSTDYLAAIQEAALRPAVFQEFYETHKDASEQSIQSELILKRGFSPDGAKIFARSFRETIAFASLDRLEYSPNGGQDKNESEAKVGQSKPPAIKPPVNPNATGKPMQNVIQPGELAVPIAEGLIARVPYPMGEDDFQLLINTLNLWKKKLVKSTPVEVVIEDCNLPPSGSEFGRDG